MSVLRPVLAVAMFAIMAALNGYIIATEDVSAVGEDEEVERRIDRLTDQLDYVSTKRAENFAAYGMDEGMTAAALDAIRRLEDKHAEHLRLLMIDIPADAEVLAESLCRNTGSTNDQLPPRYAALQFFVEERGGDLRPIRLKRTTELTRWTAARSIIQSVYETVETGTSPKDDATVMGLAAILLRRESDLFAGYRPWGSGLGGGWSWSKLQGEAPGIAERVSDYVALMHLAVELANDDEIICGGSEGFPAGDGD